jgi:hypothetical protein
MNAPAFIPTEAIAAQIRRIRECAETHEPQRLFIRCEMREALDAIERPEARSALSIVGHKSFHSDGNIRQNERLAP